MGQKSGPVKEPAEQVVKAIRRATRRQFSAEEKIRIVLSGLRGEDSIAELCRREGIVQNLVWGFFCQARCRVRLPLTSSIRWQHPDDPRGARRWAQKHRAATLYSVGSHIGSGP
jgi:hypothetical protein